MSRTEVRLVRHEARRRFAWLPTRMDAGALAGRLIWLDSYYEIPHLHAFRPARSFEVCPARYVDGRSIRWAFTD